MNGVMGAYLRYYQPRFTLHRLLNDWLGPDPRYAFMPSAIITQEKKIPDVSFYQGFINWDAMRSRTDAVIIRAGQNKWIDSQFVRNWKTAKHVGLKRGVYWFFDDRIDPGTQANILVSLIRDDMPEMEVWCDWENTYSGSFGGLKNVVAFMQAVETKLPAVKMGVYTGYWWFRERSNSTTNASQYNYLKSRPLWLAWYTPDASIVKVPAPWTKLDYWQFGTPAVGALYGVETVELDMNYFNGTEGDFRARYGGAGEPPPTGPTLTHRIEVYSDGSIQTE